MKADPVFDPLSATAINAPLPKTERSELSPESKAVVEFLAAGKQVDPEIAQRIHEKAKRIRERVFQEHGLVDIAVPGVREFRGELPEA